MTGNKISCWRGDKCKANALVIPITFLSTGIDVFRESQPGSGTADGQQVVGAQTKMSSRNNTATVMCKGRKPVTALAILICDDLMDFKRSGHFSKIF